MSTESNSESIPEVPQPEFNPTLEEIEIIEANFRQQQNVAYAIVGGAAAALVCALLWAFVTVATGYQIGYMAIGLGAAVGLTVRFLGAGIDMKFGIIGGVFALLGCVMGNLLSQVAFVANEEGSTYVETLGLLSFSNILTVYKNSFTLIEIAFYGIAVYGGYRFAFRLITTNDMIAAQQGNQSPPGYTRFRVVSAIVLFLGISFCAYYLIQASSFKKTAYYPSGVRQQEGMIEFGLREGEWNYYYESGALESKGYFLEGELDSVWQNFDQNGKLFRTAHYNKGVKHGVQMEYYPDGKIQSRGSYKFGRQTGEWQFYYPDGKLSQKGSYENNVPDGQWEHFYQDGTPLAKGAHRQGVVVGPWSYWNSKGVKTMELDFGDGTHERIINTWDDEGHPGIINGNGNLNTLHVNGTLAETGQIVNGIRNGVWKKYYDSGKLQEEGEYKSGEYFITASYSPAGQADVQNGNGTFFMYAGKEVLERGTIENGLRTGKWEQFIPGSNKVSEEANYIGGKHNGVFKTYYDDGTVHSEGEMRDGERDGTWRWYYSTGMLEKMTTYVNGKKHGNEEFYDQSGVLTHWETYDSGELVGPARD